MSVLLEQQAERMLGLLPRLRRLAQAIVVPLHSADAVVKVCIQGAASTHWQWRSQREFETGMLGLLVQACRSASAAEGCVQGAAAVSTEATDLRRNLAGLPLQQRIAIALVVLEQRSYHDAALMLEMPLSVLTHQLWQGRAALLRM